MIDRQKAMILIISSTFANAIAQLLWKFSLGKITISSLFEISKTNLFFYSGWILYIIAAALMIVSFRYGPLSLIHPFMALTQIWILIFASIYLGEPITAIKISATMLIVTGTIFVSREGRQ